jgi:GT2 family glycosyltransferase
VESELGADLAAERGDTMNIIVGIPTLNRFDLLTSSIDSALSGSVPPDEIYVIDNSGGAYPERWQARYHNRVMVHVSSVNHGVAKSWNMLRSIARIEQAQLILSNDDITFAPDTIEQLLLAAETRPRAGIVSAIEGQRFSLFWLNPELYADPAWAFDEAFQMAYFEDNDYAWRLTLARWQLAIAPTAVTHVGSATLAAMTPEQLTAKHAAYAHNAQYFVRKWGGPPHAEIYSIPFGGAAQ